MQKDKKKCWVLWGIEPRAPDPESGVLTSQPPIDENCLEIWKILKNCEPGYLILEFFQIFNNETAKKCNAGLKKSSKKIVNKFLVACLSHSTYDNNFCLSCTVMTYPHRE